MFRHSQASVLADDLTEAQMNEYLGWKQGSKMPAIYVHLSGRNVDQKILELKGIKKPEKRTEASAVKSCARCEHVNPPTSKFCMKCALPLDLKAALEVEDERKKQIEDLQRQLKESGIEKLRQELQEIRFAVRMLEDASGLKVVPQHQT
jgi:hypothetical protein